LAKIKFTRNLDQVVKKINDMAAQRMAETCLHVQNKTKEKLSGNRTGRTYRVPGTNRTYTASAPGEPPAVMHGQLRTSIQSRVKGGRTVSGEVGSGLKKAVELEFGTKRIKPRPFLRPTFQEELPEIKNILSRRWF